LSFCNSMLFEDPLDSSLGNVVSENTKKSKGLGFN
jgi:hypothetical protein